MSSDCPRIGDKIAIGRYMNHCSERRGMKESYGYKCLFCIDLLKVLHPIRPRVESRAIFGCKVNNFFLNAN